MTHIAEKFKELDFFPYEVLKILEEYYDILHPAMRLLMVNCLRMMRTKNVVNLSSTIPVLFKLFRCKDKNLRSVLTSNIIGDLKLVNKKQKCSKVNKTL